jgi:limonene-1,2-epoxide hydrolase
MSNANEQAVIDFFKAFESLEVEAALSYLTEDCVYDCKPDAVYTGKEEIRNLFGPQLAEMKSFRGQLNDTLTVGDTVVNERIDYVEFPDGSKAAVPVMGAFEIRAGKIAVWRDYYDMASYEKQLSGS